MQIVGYDRAGHCVPQPTRGVATGVVPEDGSLAGGVDGSGVEAGVSGGGTIDGVPVDGVAADGVSTIGGATVGVPATGVAELATIPKA